MPRNDPIPHSHSGAAAGGVFSATRWSLVLSAGDSLSTEGRSALESLCRAYWYPLYAFVRRSGLGAHDAEDAVQGFFGHLLEQRLIAGADPHRGRFRSYLLAILQNWLSNERQRARAAKRGGGKPPVEFDALDAEERYALEPATTESPARQYERSWAESAIAQAMSRLEAELPDDIQRRRFAALRPLMMSTGSERYAEVGAALGMQEGAVKVAVHRLRKRFGEVLRECIRETLANPAEVDAEMRHLLESLGG